MSNIMAFEAFSFVHEWQSITYVDKLIRVSPLTFIFGELIGVLFVICLAILCRELKNCTRVTITKKYTLKPREWGLSLCTSEVVLSFHSLMIFIATCNINIFSLSIGLTIVIVTLLASIGVWGISTTLKLLRVNIFWCIRVCIIFARRFTYITKTRFIKRRPLTI